VNITIDDNERTHAEIFPLDQTRDKHKIHYTFTLNGKSTQTLMSVMRQFNGEFAKVRCCSNLFGTQAV